MLVDEIANANVFRVLKEEVNSQERVFLANPVYTTYPILNRNYCLESEFELFHSKYAYFAQNTYDKMVQCSEYGTLTSDANFFIDNVIDCGDYYSINGWFYVRGENIESKSSANASWGLKNLTTDTVYILDSNAVFREDISRNIADGYNYDYAGIYGRVAKEEINATNNQYEIVIIYGGDNAEIKGTGRMLID